MFSGSVVIDWNRKVRVREVSPWRASVLPARSYCHANALKMHRILDVKFKFIPESIRDFNVIDLFTACLEFDP